MYGKSQTMFTQAMVNVHVDVLIYMEIKIKNMHACMVYITMNNGALVNKTRPTYAYVQMIMVISLPIMHFGWW